MLLPACLLTPKPDHIPLSGAHFPRDPQGAVDLGVLTNLYGPSPFTEEFRFEEGLLSDNVVEVAADTLRKLRAA